MLIGMSLYNVLLATCSVITIFPHALDWLDTLPYGTQTTVDWHMLADSFLMISVIRGQDLRQLTYYDRYYVVFLNIRFDSGSFQSRRCRSSVLGQHSQHPALRRGQLHVIRLSRIVCLGHFDFHTRAATSNCGQ